MEDPTTAAAKTVLSSEENKEDFEDSLEDFGEDGEFSYLGPLGKTSELNNANNGSSSNNKTTAASIGIGVTIGVVIAIAFIGFLVYRTKKTNDTNNNNRSNMKRSSLADQEEEEDDEFENEHYPSTSFQQHYRKGSAVADNLTAESLTNVELDQDGDNHDGHYHHQQQHHVDVDFDVDEYSLDHSSLGTSMTSDIPLKRSHRSKQQKSYRSGSAYSSWSNRWGGGGRGSNRSVSPNRNSNNSKGNHRRNPSQDSFDLESQGDASSTAFSYTEVGASTSFGEGSAPSIASKGKFSGGMHNKNHRRNDSGLSQDSYEGDEQHHGGAYRINFDLLMEDLKEEEKELEDDHSFSNNNNHNNDTTINKISRYSERDAEDNGVECTLMPSPTSVSKFRRVYSSAQQNQQQNSSTTLSISPSHSSLHSENNNISTIPTVSTTPTRNSRRSLHNNNSNHNSSNMTNSSNMLLSTSQYTIVTSPSEGEIPFDEITNKKAAQPQEHNMDNHNNNNSPSSANSTKKKKRITPPVPSEKLLTMPLPRVSSMKSNGTDNDSLGGDDIVQDLSDFLRERRRAKQNARSRSILDESAHLNENE